MRILIQKEDPQKTPSLKIQCNKHGKEIIMFNLNPQKTELSILACVECIQSNDPIKYGQVDTPKKQGDFSRQMVSLDVVCNKCYLGMQAMKLHSQLKFCYRQLLYKLRNFIKEQYNFQYKKPTGEWKKGIKDQTMRHKQSIRKGIARLPGNYNPYVEYRVPINSTTLASYAAKILCIRKGIQILKSFAQQQCLLKNCINSDGYRNIYEYQSQYLQYSQYQGGDVDIILREQTCESNRQLLLKLNEIQHVFCQTSSQEAKSNKNLGNTIQEYFQES
ncbi:unnamed protein product [Paramecium octaurelia]|uniref:Uncharacterized protein n=1 Tax=Paramecium octaurelia TaxID=43137 RepID=A0A8S1VMG7_PAROT|nr:unnamed protein product [Paramecium octaurelia]